MIPYSKKLWWRKNFGEFGESPQFAKFFYFVQCHKALAIRLLYLCFKSGVHAWLEYFKVAFLEI